MQKVFKFEMGGMYTVYAGKNLGDALQKFIADRPTYIHEIESITEYPARANQVLDDIAELSR